jgi:DeoR family glycerol-3-phosphate regulon repressor
MTPKERQARVLDIIRAQRRASVDELAAALAASRETIRRDLGELARAGQVLKFHGGAGLPLPLGEGPFQERMAENAAAKLAIAERAARLFAPGETLLVDTGSTTLYFAEKLAAVPDLTVVTNSAEIARVVSRSGMRSRVFLLGGEYHLDNQQTVGTLAVSQIRAFRAHAAVIAVGALDARSGAMDFNIEEALIAQAMIEQAQSVTVLADSSKFDRIASFAVCPLARIANLVCEAPPEGALLEAVQKAGIRLHLPTRPPVLIASGNSTG